MSDWFYAKNNQQIGPVSEEQLRQLMIQGVVLATDMVWREGMADWEPANVVFPGAQPAMAPSMGQAGMGQMGVGQGMAPGMMYAPPDASANTQKTLAILSIVGGCLAVVCCPIVFGVGGIICGAVAMNKPGPHGGLAKTGLYISIGGTVLGFILGALLFMNK